LSILVIADHDSLPDAKTLVEKLRNEAKVI
jgi:hypothetical protein